MNITGKGRWAGLLAAALVIGGSWLAGAAMVQAKDKNGGGHTPVTLCHFVPAHGGSFITITVDDDGSSGNKNLQGHAGHEKDIIPAPAGACPANVDKTATPIATNTSVAAATMTATQSSGATSTPSATATTGGGGANAATNTPAATETTALGPTSTATVSGAAAALEAETPEGQGEVLAAAAGPISLPNTGTGPDSGRNYGAIAIAVLAVIILGATGVAMRSRGTRP